MPQPPLTDGEVIAQAQEIVASAIPNWQQDEPIMVDYLNRHPVDISPAIRTGDPSTVAKALFSVHTAAQLDRSARQTKQAAQTLTGSNSSTEPETAWDRIAAARSGVPRFRI